MQAMLLRAGLVSLALLLASRLLGLLRESMQAATLGATGQADAAILMLTLPDLLTGILAAGALSYVLLPLWARQSTRAQSATLWRLGRILFVAGLLLATGIFAAPGLVTGALAPGLSEAARASAARALGWSAAALPLAILAALWTTRLQHRRDFTGMYGANLVVNSTVVAALLLIAAQRPAPIGAPLTWLGWSLLIGMALRLLWLGGRLRRGTALQANAPEVAAPDTATGWPPTPVWLWAMASAGLPLMLPLLGRSLASTTGEGALTTFNYAWKLVELPLVLAIQLVAALAFPGIAKAFSPRAGVPEKALRSHQRKALRNAFVVAWVMACAAAAALSGMAPALAQLLFGWGRMPPEAVAQVGAWGRVGAWSLLPQALLAVLLTLMASTGRLRGAVMAYGGALALLAGLGWAAGLVHAANGLSGELVMWAINGALGAAAVALLFRERSYLRGVLRWVDLLPAAIAAMVLALAAAHTVAAPARLQGLLLALLLAASVGALAWLCSPGLRQALRR